MLTNPLDELGINSNLVNRLRDKPATIRKVAEALHRLQAQTFHPDSNPPPDPLPTDKTDLQHLREKEAIRTSHFIAITQSREALEKEGMIDRAISQTLLSPREQVELFRSDFNNTSKMLSEENDVFKRKSIEAIRLLLDSTSPVKNQRYIITPPQEEYLLKETGDFKHTKISLKDIKKSLGTNLKKELSSLLNELNPKFTTRLIKDLVEISRENIGKAFTESVEINLDNKKNTYTKEDLERKINDDMVLIVIEIIKERLNELVSLSNTRNSIDSTDADFESLKEEEEVSDEEIKDIKSNEEKEYECAYPNTLTKLRQEILETVDNYIDVTKVSGYSALNECYEYYVNENGDLVTHELSYSEKINPFELTDSEIAKRSDCILIRELQASGNINGESEEIFRHEVYKRIDKSKKVSREKIIGSFEIKDGLADFFGLYRMERDCGLVLSTTTTQKQDLQKDAQTLKKINTLLSEGLPLEFLFDKIDLFSPSIFPRKTIQNKGFYKPAGYLVKYNPEKNKIFILGVPVHYYGTDRPFTREDLMADSRKEKKQ